MEIVGYIAFILVGLTLGLIGGGGSILAVPILVYLFWILRLILQQATLWFLLALFLFWE